MNESDYFPLFCLAYLLLCQNKEYQILNDKEIRKAAGDQQDLQNSNLHWKIFRKYFLY